MTKMAAGGGGGAYQVCSNDDPRFDLDLLNIKAKFAS